MIKINDIIYSISSAEEMPYDNSSSEAVSTNIQDVIDELWREIKLRALKDFEVVYMVDTGVGYKENVTLGSTALLPESFTPAKEGYTFIGWRRDNVASSDVLTECTVGEEPITLHAVFKKEVILTYNGNSATSGSNFTSSSWLYYNTGNIKKASFNLELNRFTKTDNKFFGWRTGTSEGTVYDVNAVFESDINTTLYAYWKPTKLNVVVNGVIQNGYAVTGQGLSYSKSIGASTGNRSTNAVSVSATINCGTIEAGDSVVIEYTKTATVSPLSWHSSTGGRYTATGSAACNIAITTAGTSQSTNPASGGYITLTKSGVLLIQITASGNGGAATDSDGDTHYGGYTLNYKINNVFIKKNI